MNSDGTFSQFDAVTPQDTPSGTSTPDYAVYAQGTSVGQQPCASQPVSSNVVANTSTAQPTSITLHSIFVHGSEYYQLPSLFAEVEQNVKINVDVVSAIVGQRFTLESFIKFLHRPDTLIKQCRVISGTPQYLLVSSFYSDFIRERVHNYISINRPR